MDLAFLVVLLDFFDDGLYWPSSSCMSTSENVKCLGDRGDFLRGIWLWAFCNWNKFNLILVPPPLLGGGSFVEVGGAKV